MKKVGVGTDEAYQPVELTVLKCNALGSLFLSSHSPGGACSRIEGDRSNEIFRTSAGIV